MDFIGENKCYLRFSKQTEFTLNQEMKHFNFIWVTKLNKIK